MHSEINRDPAEIFMHTSSGHKYYPFAPKTSDIRIKVIAQHLACTARWQGATCHPTDPNLIFYSVAEHSVYVSEYIEYNLKRPDLALEGLLHDAVEGFIGDQIRPVKYSPALYGPFKKLEDLNENVMAMKYNLQWPWPKEIKIADEAVCSAEDIQLIRKDPSEEWSTGKLHDDRNVADISIHMLLPLQARDFFMSRYRDLLARGLVNRIAA